MAAAHFGAYIVHEDDKYDAKPKRTKLAVPPNAQLRSPSNFELDNLHWGQRLAPPTNQFDMPTTSELDSLQWGQKLNGPEVSDAHGMQMDIADAQTPRQLEASQPTTPDEARVVDAIVQSATNPPQNKWRLMSASAIFTLCGLNDGATGAQIPYLEKEYDIGYALVSLVFVANACGFLVAAPLAQAIDSLWGRSRAYVISTMSMTVGFLLLSCAPPFPVVVIAFFFLGFGTGLFLGMTNAFVVNLLNGTVILGFMHGLYGVGGIAAPLIATAMASSGIRWSFYYLVPLLLSTISILTMGLFFRGFEEDAAVRLHTVLSRTASRHVRSEAQVSKLEQFLQSIKSKITLLGATFIFFYQGGEVAISGWVISFLISYRHGDPGQVGNVTSGFWAGITLGRFVLTHFAHKMGEKVAVAGLIIGAAVFQLLVWLIPNIIGNAVAESLVGLFLGPVYPCATAVFAKLLPRDMQINSLAFITSMGSSGGALVPFITGLMAQRLGTAVLHPIVLFSFVWMMVGWILLPRVNKRSE